MHLLRDYNGNLVLIDPQRHSFFNSFRQVPSLTETLPFLLDKYKMEPELNFFQDSSVKC